MRTETMSRPEVRAAAQCPECGAEPGARCVGARGRQRESNHASRVKAAAARTPRPGSSQMWGEIAEDLERRGAR